MCSSQPADTELEVYDKRGIGFYRGYKIQAVARLHQIAMQMVTALHLDEKTSCLDLGAGSGAFSLRLHDAGYSVECVEFAPLSLSEKDIEVHQLDLNSAFSTNFHGRYFHLITCLEVLEHLENSFHFFRECNKILYDGGFLLVSTPNLESWMARLQFLYNGHLPWFNRQYFCGMRHLTPQFSWQLPLIAQECRFALIKIVSTANKYMLHAGPKSHLALAIKGIFCLFLRPLMRGRRDGDINLYLFHKIAGF